MKGGGSIVHSPSFLMLSLLIDISSQLASLHDSSTISLLVAHLPKDLLPGSCAETVALKGDLQRALLRRLAAGADRSNNQSRQDSDTNRHGLLMVPYSSKRAGETQR